MAKSDKLETLKVQERTQKGKGPNRRLRKQDLVPGIYYDQKGHNFMVQTSLVPMTKAISKFGSSHVFSLEIDHVSGATETYPCLLWRVKYDPIKPKPIHVDFFGVDLAKDIRVHVPFEVTGTAIGVKRDGGVLELYRETIEVVCKPLDIPESIAIDVTELALGQNLSITQVVFPEGVTPIYEGDPFAVVGVTTIEEEEAPKEAAEGEAAPAAPAAPAAE
ncbi:MAG: 50S ribosomal protein L25 [Desulfovibrionaceae bacterium]